MSTIDELVEWNHRYGGEAATPGVQPQPRTSVTMVTCMDARISIPKIFGVHPGDVHVLRNAGGIVTDDTLRSVVVSQVELDTDEVMVIQHTRCGMLGLVDRDFREKVSRMRGRTPTFTVGGFTDLERRVSESVRELRRNTLVDGEVRGFVFDVDTGLVTEVAVS